MTRDQIVICSCGQWNRITATGRKRCDKCGQRLALRDNTGIKHLVRWGAVTAVAILVFVVAIGNAKFFPNGPSLAALRQLLTQGAAPQHESAKVKSAGIDTASAPSPAPSFQLKAVAVKNGVIRRREEQSAIAGLRVQVPSSANYVLKLVNVRDRKEELLVYVARGTSYETKVPLGTYKILGASGDEWYGETHLFGGGTSYFSLSNKNGESEFRFYRTEDRIVGLDIRLTPEITGTLETQFVGEEEFRW